MVEALVDPSMRDMCYGAYYADETPPGEIVSNAETLPFLTDRRVILVRGAERYGSEAAMGALLRYLESPCETTVLIFVAQQVDRRSKFFKACDKNGEIIECGTLRDREVGQWIHEELKELDKKMDPAAVQELISRVGTSLSDVHNALNLVSAYVGESPKIAASDVAEACADVAEEEVWALTDAIAQSNTKNALRVLRALYDLGKSEFEVLGSINWLLKTAYGVAAAAPSDPILRSFPGKKCKPLADKFGAKKLGDAFGLLVETDFMLRSTGVDRSLALELLVIKLAAPGRRRRSA
jgi:DNA polymerase-3 subunit delta